MPHSLPALAVVVAAPLVALAVHVASVHAGGVATPVRAAAALPNNLCASCHGGRKVSAGRSAALDLVAARAFLSRASRG